MTASTISDIKARLPLADVIGRDQLRQEGPRYLRHREHSSLVIDTVKEVWHWNARGHHGDLIDWWGYDRFGDAWSPRDARMFREVVADLARRAGLPAPGGAPRPRPALPIDPLIWLRGRGVREETARHFRIEADRAGVGFPVLRDGEEVARRWKNFDSEAKSKYRWSRHSPEALVYNLDGMADGGLIVAGEPDVWICTQAALPACSFLYGEGTAPKPEAIHLLRQRGIARVRVIYDHDPAGHNGARAAAAILRDGGIEATVLRLPQEVGLKGDLTDLYQRCGLDDHAFRDAVLGLAADGESIPDSLPLKGPGIGNADASRPDVVRVWEQAEPPPRRFAIAKLVPDGVITSLYGDGGQGKSLIALALATHAPLGRPFAGLEVEQRVALYIDAELDAEEFVRRAYKVARGLGLQRPPEDLYYWRLPGSLSDPVLQAEARRVVAGCGATLVVLDSLTIATHGADPTDAQDTTQVMKAIEAWGAAVIAIDHSAKPSPGANLSNYRQFGSAFKGYLSRSVVQVVRAEGGGVALRQTKTNFGPLAEPVHLALEFGDDTVRIAAIDAADERLSGIDDHLPAIERVARALGERLGGATPGQLAEDLALSEKTIRNHLTALKQRDRATPLGDGRWGTVPDSRCLKDREPGTVPAEIPPDLEEVAEWSA